MKIDNNDKVILYNEKEEKKKKKLKELEENDKIREKVYQREYEEIKNRLKTTALNSETKKGLLEELKEKHKRKRAEIAELELDFAMKKIEKEYESKMNEENEKEKK